MAEREVDIKELLKVKPLKTAKAGIKQLPLMKAGVIPHHHSVSIFSARAGSGKSCLVRHLLENLYVQPDCSPYFELIIMFRPTADDAYDGVISEDQTCNDCDPEDLKEVLSMQKADIDRKGIEKR